MEDSGPHKLQLDQQPTIDLMRVDGGDPIEVPEPPVGAAGVLLDVPVEREARVAELGGVGKRRRGRPPRSTAKALHTEDDDDGEDVCFICFDGGNLVLCDRRSCPKAYHPACIKREESFFRSKAKWNCGWHICTKCHKAGHHMCYTCTFSVCKKCVKDADFVSIRANMGFCGICLKTIKLIENVPNGEKEAVQVDFDDKTSWEYLFKVYWLCLKEKLSLTLDELTNAKNPWKEACIVAAKVEPRHDRFSVDHSNKRKPRGRSRNLNKSDSLGNNNSNNYGQMLPKATKWATEELLEFVALMKNGDMSLLPQLDVQALLLEYITRNNLRDPRQKSHVICDSMLLKLFRKERVGHIEMLKLLESHFLIQENSSTVTFINEGVKHSVSSHMEEDSDWEMMGSDKRRKTRNKKGDTRGQTMNPDEYAAIDLHNINLIFLRRNLLETLADDINKVHKQAVGSIARIKVSGNNQKQEKFRLVQVVGTCKAAKHYQIGTRTTDVMLEILNLEKQEVISIDEISDQDFTEDECKRLRQSMKCGFNKALTVGEITEKAVTFQALKVKEDLEAEILKLNHLRDRASENGRRKELRECVDKLELLKSPEEHQRRVTAIPEVHADPSMDPNFLLTEDARLSFNKQECPALVVKEREHVVPQVTSAGSNNLENNAQKNVASGFLCGRNSSADKNGNAQFVERLKSPDIQDAAGDDEEANALWHYQDPSGKIQGPFSLSQLRKWKTSGHFPLDLRIWRNYGSRDNSVLLTDALDGMCHNSPTLLNGSPPSQEPVLASNDQVQSSDNRQDVSEKKIQFDINQDVHAYADSDGNSVFSKSSLASSASSSSSGCAVVLVAGDLDGIQTGNLVPSLSVSEADNTLNGQSQANLPVSSSMISVNQKEYPEAAPIHSNEKSSDDQSNTGFSSLNQEFNFLDLPSSKNPKSPEDQEAQAAETIQSLASSVLIKGTSCPDWYTATSSQVMEGLQNAPFMASLSEKSAEYVATTQTSETDPVAHSSDWFAILADPDESVSDLLAEVEAMESMNNGLPSSPTSTFQCDDDDKDGHNDEDMTENYQNPGAYTAMLVGRAIEPPKTTPTDYGQQFAHILDYAKVIQEEPEKGANFNNDASLNRCKTGSELPFLATKYSVQDSPNVPKRDSETTGANHSSSVTRGFPHLISKPEQGSVGRNTNVNGFPGSNFGPGMDLSHRHNGEFSDRESGSGLGREMPWWMNGSHNQQYTDGNGMNQTHPPKGLRVCKFYESGYCKKGAACSFWHP